MRTPTSAIPRTSAVKVSPAAAIAFAERVEGYRRFFLKRAPFGVPGGGELPIPEGFQAIIDGETTTHALLEQALELDPGARSLHSPLAQAYRALGDTAQAEAHLKQRGIVEAFLERFVAAAEALVIGDPKEDRTEFGTMASQEHFTKVRGYLDEAALGGGSILTGGIAGLLGGMFSAGGPPLVYLLYRQPKPA